MTDTGKVNSTRPGVRLDIEGLRAVAIGSVVAFHGLAQFFPGGFVGVDVFFVISGFLITGVILREVEASGRLSLARFWSRRAKRLLPASAVVLAFSAVVSAVWLPRTQGRIFGGDIVGAAGYVVNWRLAGRSVDYLAEGIATSPVQHYWSLAVEEQFYVLWPLLIVAAVWLAKKTGGRLRPVLGATIGVVTAGSLATSILETASAPASAFFVTHTRMWELGLGALAALGAEQLARIPQRVAAATGMVGLVAVVGSIWVFGPTTTWPSWRPALPCLGAAAVIIAGLQPGGPAGWLCSRRPLVWLGGLSYSLYLWHWPFLVAALSIWPDVGRRVPALAVSAAIIPAWLVNKLIENPIRFSPELTRRPGLALSVGANCSLIGALCGLALVGLPHPGPDPTTTDVMPDVLGARAVHEGGGNLDALAAVESYDPIVPDPLVAAQDLPISYQLKCRATTDTPPPPCINGDEKGKVRVVAVGDSIMQQWEPALKIIGKERGIRFELTVLSGCTLSPAYILVKGEPYVKCKNWGIKVLDRILADPPDAVLVSHVSFEALTSQDQAADEATEQALTNGLHSYWSRLAEAGIPIILLAANPRFDDEAIYECVDKNRTSLSQCALKAITETSDAQQRAVETSPVPIDFINLNDAICGDLCPAVIGNVLVYRQGRHFTATFAKTLAPRLDAALAKIPALAGASWDGPLL
ncbi:MAG: acyltransferase [Micrococcales bacterium]|nr:acyltransferase [Micrococcales bacterium]